MNDFKFNGRWHAWVPADRPMIVICRGTSEDDIEQKVLEYPGMTPPEVVALARRIVDTQELPGDAAHPD